MLRDGPLHLAAQAGDARKVARLIAEGEIADARNFRMYTPLHIAAGMGASEVVAALLAASADARALTTFQTTPPHEVAHCRVGSGDAPVEIIDRLLEAGCPLNAVDTNGRTALWCAAATGTAPWSPGQQDLASGSCDTCWRAAEVRRGRGPQDKFARRLEPGAGGRKRIHVLRCVISHDERQSPAAA